MPKWTSSGAGRIRRWVLICVVLAVGFAAGNLLRQPSVAGADSRGAPPRKTFLSGSERSAVVLQEILTVLKRMDGRLERIERTVTAKPKQ